MQSKSMNGHAGQGGWATVVAAMLLACTSVQAQTKARLLPPLKSHLVAAAAAPQTTPPGWPQRFELLSGEHESKGFAVTQPGPLRISLQTSGVPLVVSLQRPDGRSLERQGTGQIVIDDTASAADIGRGLFWGIGIRALQQPAVVPQGLVRGPQPPQVVASGSIDLLAPPVDSARVQAAEQARQSQAQQRAATQVQSVAMVDPQVLSRASQRSFDQQVAQRQAAELDKLRATLKPEVQAQLSQRIGLRLQGQSLQQSQLAAPVQMLSTASNQTGLSVNSLRTTPGVILLPSKGLGVVAGTASTDKGGAVLAKDTAVPSMPPQFAAISAGAGDPGTPLSLSGSDLGDAPGEVHFIVGNGRDISAPVTYWSAQQIVTEVPYADGIPAYDGYVYVLRGDGAKTALKPFHFTPLYDVAVLGLPLQSTGDLGEWTSRFNDSRLLNPGVFTVFSRASISPNLAHTVGHFYIGFAAYDEYYLSTRLKNGWLVDSAQLVHGNDNSIGPASNDPNHAGAYITELRVGTDSPYLKVRWWVDNGSKSVAYGAAITVKRPKNLPCSANPCPVL